MQSFGPQELSDQAERKLRADKEYKEKLHANAEEMLEILRDLNVSNSYWWQEVGLDIADRVEAMTERFPE